MALWLYGFMALWLYGFILSASLLSEPLSILAFNLHCETSRAQIAVYDSPLA